MTGFSIGKWDNDMHQIKVINQNKEAVSDRHDGMLYTFSTGEKGINIPLDAAEHIFGVEFPMNKDACASEEFRTQIWNHLQKRWGWNATPTRKEMEKGDASARLMVGRKFFDKISFVPAEMKMIEVVANNDDLPLPRGSEEDINVDDEEAV